MMAFDDQRSAVDNEASTTSVTHRSSEMRKVHREIQGSIRQRGRRPSYSYATNQAPTKHLLAIHEELVDRYRLDSKRSASKKIHRSSSPMRRVHSDIRQGSSRRKRGKSPATAHRNIAKQTPTKQLRAIHEELIGRYRVDSKGSTTNMHRSSPQMRRVHSEMQGSVAKRQRACSHSSSCRHLTKQAPTKQLLAIHEELKVHQRRRINSTDSSRDSSSSSRIPKRSPLARYKNKWASTRSLSSDDLSNSSLIIIKSTSSLSDSSMDVSLAESELLDDSDSSQAKKETKSAGPSTSLKSSRNNQGLMSLSDLAGMLSSQVSVASEDLLNCKSSGRGSSTSSRYSSARQLELSQGHDLDTHFAKLKG